MSSRRDRLLQQMGITQYQLRRPQALQGEIAVAVPAQTRLLIVTDSAPSPADPLVADVLNSLLLTAQQTFTLTPDQLAMVQDNAACPCWFLGVDVPATAADIALSSPSLESLTHSADAKKAFWQQICQYENHFFSHQHGS